MESFLQKVPRRQTKPDHGFTLIINDSGHRKSGAATAGVGRQYIGQIGKTDTGVVLLTTHLYDGVRGLPLDVGLYRHASSLPEGKNDPHFRTKPNLALQLIDHCLERGQKPGVVLIDAGYGNNTPFLKQVENKMLTYIGAIAKNRRVRYRLPRETVATLHRLDVIAKEFPATRLTPVVLPLAKPRRVWVALIEVDIPNLGQR